MLHLVGNARKTWKGGQRLNHFGLFVRIDGEWRLEGIVQDSDAVSKFIHNVEKDILATRDSQMRTEGYKVVTVTL
jgi:predicted RNA-binding protein with RPS1 domain